MSIQLLKALNGGLDGKLSAYIKSLKNEPRIAWYPCAGQDLRDLLCLGEAYNEREIVKEIPPAPKIFLHTDYFPWESDFLNSPVLHDDGRTKITATTIEELPRLDLPLDPQIVHFKAGSEKTGRVVYLELTVESHRLGTFNCRLIYAFVVNEPFYAKIALPNKARFSYIVKVVYSGGFGGGNTNGVWLKNILAQTGCEVLIADERNFSWQKGDRDAVRLYPELGSSGKEGSVELDKSNIIHRSHHWHDQEVVNWHLLVSSNK